MIHEKILQREARKGHQPWRLVDVDVAKQVISHFYGDENVIFERRVVVVRGKRELLSLKGTRQYRVKLKKLFGAEGIWSAVAIEAEEIR